MERRKIYETELRNCHLPVPELYFATVRAIGTPLNQAVVRPLNDALRRAGYMLVEIKLSDCLAVARAIPEAELSASRTARYELLNQEGEAFRSESRSGDAIAVEAMRRLNETVRQQSREKAYQKGLRGVAYLFRSLHHPDEAKRLRKMYGRQLFIISLFSSEENRTKHLQRWLAEGDSIQSRITGGDAARLVLAESGMLRFAESAKDESQLKYRNNIPATWKHADLFLDLGEQGVAGQVDRLVRLIFSDPFRTPRPVEMGMAEAYLAAHESANLARRVGASIVSADELLLAVGTNNVAQPTGGVYRSGSECDHRDHTPEWEHDPSDRERRAVLTNFIEHILADTGWMKVLDGILQYEPDSTKDASASLRRALESHWTKVPNVRSLSAAVVDQMIASEVIWNSQTFDVLEYGRSLHAEMDALTSAARKHLTTKGATLFCTTLPCHECARLIIGAGIKRVYFVEPYDKSRAMELFRTEVKLLSRSESLDRSEDGFVHFVPYVGIAPVRFDELFSWVPRKLDDLLIDSHSEPVAAEGSTDSPHLASGKREPDEVIGRSHRMLDGALAPWDPATADVRESIISMSALASRSRLVDVLLHERETIGDFDKQYEGSRALP